MTELKPCPFCGGEAHLQPFMGYWTVGCTDCFGAVMGKIETKEEAIEAWNKRDTWHTGTPTEGGLFLVHLKSGEYDIFYFNDGYNTWDIGFRDVVAWQKITPFEGEEVNG